MNIQIGNNNSNITTFLHARTDLLCTINFSFEIKLYKI